MVSLASKEYGDNLSNIQTALLGVDQIYSADLALAAVLDDGFFLMWSTWYFDSDLRIGMKWLVGVIKIHSTHYAFDAVL